MRKNQNLTEKVTIKFTSAEKTALDMEAAAEKITRSELVRQKILTPENAVSAESQKELYIRLLQTGNEIGVFADRVRTEKNLPRHEVLQIVDQMRKEVYEACQLLK